MKLNNNIKAIIVAVLCFPLLASCEKNENLEVFNYTASPIINSAKSKYIIDNGKYSGNYIDLFNTTTTIRVYSKNEQAAKKVADNFDETMQYYHVLFDRHHTYSYRENNEVINNLYTINETKQDGKTSIKLDPVLYNALKEAVEYSKVSEGYYNLFVGNLTDLYTSYIEQAERNLSSFTFDNEGNAINNDNPYRFLSTTNEFKVYKSIPQEEIDKAMLCTPQPDEFDSIIKFNDTDNSVTITNTSRCQQSGGKLSVSMSGQGKGYAVDKFIDDNSKEVLFVNGGSSSIRTNLKNPGRDNWQISYANPYFNEVTYFTWFDPGTVTSPMYCQVDSYFKYPDSFNLSTSAYYEHYYYIPVDENGNEIDLSNISKEDSIKSSTYEDYKINKGTRINHIVNPKTGNSENCFDLVSVLLDNSIADMVTTSLMATPNLTEAKKILNNIEEHYNIDNINAVFFSKDEKYRTLHKPTYFTEINDEDYNVTYHNSSRNGIPYSYEDIKPHYYITESMSQYFNKYQQDSEYMTKHIENDYILDII